MSKASRQQLYLTPPLRRHFTLEAADVSPQTTGDTRAPCNATDLFFLLFFLMPQRSILNRRNLDTLHEKDGDVRRE